jgi:hypothetical protein
MSGAAAPFTIWKCLPHVVEDLFSDDVIFVPMRYHVYSVEKHGEVNRESRNGEVGKPSTFLLDPSCE